MHFYGLSCTYIRNDDSVFLLYILLHIVNYLRFGEPQRTRELCSLSYAQVLFIPEFLLEGQQLLRRERRSRFPVRFVLSEVAFQFGWVSVGVYNEETNLFYKIVVAWLCANRLCVWLSLQISVYGYSERASVKLQHPRSSCSNSRNRLISKSSKNSVL